MKAFAAATTPFQPGFTVIEASAGTGKTTAITLIALRLIVKEAVPLEKILMTTYTELATAELRARMREVLLAAQSTLAGETEDSLTAPIVRLVDPALAQRRLHAALTVFDEAAIYTIHGFCRRVLSDRAFETGELFETELVAEQSDVLREVAQDFVRRNLYSASRIVSAAAEAGDVKVDDLVELLTEIANNPAIQIVPEEKEDWRVLAGQLETCWQNLWECWRASSEAVREKLKNPGWAKQRYREAVPAMLEEMSCLEGAGAGDLIGCIRFFSDSAIAAGTRAGGISPSHDFFKHCQDVTALATRLPLAFKQEFCAWVREELVRRKNEQQAQSFSDLLTSLDHALRVDERGALARNLRERYGVALIDEFQDTDPVQYSIFSQIYRGSEASVFLIGDPKQAIYGFRGADVFTYLEATRNAARFSLPKNYRSEKNLVAGVNSIFARDDAFVLPGIEFSPAETSDRAEKKEFALDGKRSPPLRVWVTDNPEEIPSAIAGEVARLLEGKFGTEKVKPAEIAVLVHTNAQAPPIQSALSRLGIPSVVYTAANVFSLREAGQMRLVLRAVAEPANSQRLRAALLTTPFGLNATTLAGLSDATTEDRANRFADYHRIWRDEGFVEMMREMLTREGIRARLLALIDGERRLTNWLHLIELLHCACCDHRFGIEGLITWLERRMSERTPTPEEYELRLESDDDAVRLVTVHKSKGLEYGIAFCPYAWEPPMRNKRLIKFHQNNALVLALDKSSTYDEPRRTERLAEAVRQFYVALTRAQHRAYFIWAGPGRTNKSATAWLFSSGAPPRFVKDGETPDAVLRRLCALNGDAICVEEMPGAGSSKRRAPSSLLETLSAREQQHAIDRGWGIASFSSLISGRRGEIEEEDIDAIDEVEAIEEPQIVGEGFHDFPRGARGGTCLHRIFEEAEFVDEANVRATTAKWLKRFHLDRFQAVTAETVLRALRTPLGETRLETIGSVQRVREMHFTFPLRQITLRKLGELFAGAEPPLTIDRLQFHTVRGFMKGSIDLVFESEGKFFIVDWKSNALGPGTDNYTAEELANEMQRNFYVLQLHIYVLALHLYLRERLPDYDYDRQFGGASYVFLRGLENSSRGVFLARPPLSFIEKLDRVIHGRA